MKTIKFTLSITLLAVFLSGCLTSVHPLFKPNQVILKKELLGTWETYNAIWSFQTVESVMDENTSEEERQRHKNDLLLFYITGQDSVGFIAQTGKLGKHEYIDFYPLMYEVEPGFLSHHLHTMHSFHRMQLSGDTLKFSMVKESYLTNLMKQRKIKIKHEISNDKFILTASTDEIQKFVIKYGDTPDAYEKATVLTRIKP